MKAIDLNCDLGEGAGQDAELMPLITSVNVACGAHAGDDDTMRATVALALRHGVAIGAHPGLPDREHFGRREMVASSEKIYDWVREQTARLQELTREVSARVTHVKPHGALYHMAARDATLAAAVAQAVKDCDERLWLVGLSGSALPEAGLRVGLRVAHEVFADRAYHRDGALVARGDERALLTDPDTATERMLGLMRTGRIRSVEGEEVALQADTICLHGDGARVVDFARALRRGLARAGVVISPAAV